MTLEKARELAILYDKIIEQKRTVMALKRDDNMFGVIINYARRHEENSDVLKSLRDSIILEAEQELKKLEDQLATS